VLCYNRGMRQALKLHPESRCAAVSGIGVELLRGATGDLILRYAVTGAIGDLLLPAATAPARADALWQHTCFEAFLRPLPGAAYCEFNFAPSRHWAIYRFGGYRRDMSVAAEIAAPRIETQLRGERYELQASLALDGMKTLLPGAAWRVALSAVIEETNGGKSYWALAHPQGKPDFHHDESFALEISATGQP
jgi:hypothetical protein